MKSIPNDCDLALLYNEKIPKEVEHDFALDIDHPEIRFRSEQLEDKGPYAGIAWLLPTAVILWIGKSYFESFLKEAGKDHYHLLKKALARIWHKLFSKEKIISISIITSGKAPKKGDDDPYSIAFSIIYPIAPKTILKFLFHNDNSISDYETYVDLISDLVNRLSNDSGYCLSLLEKNKACIIMGQLIMTYDKEKKELIALNPIRTIPKDKEKM
jgi:hypothetical protein